MEDRPVETTIKTIGSGLRAPKPLPDGFYYADQFLSTQETCRQLGEYYLEKFLAHPSFLSAHPVLLGSLARGELCPKSDLDLGFLGDEASVRSFVQDFQKQGVKIRSRMLDAATIAGWPVLEQLSLLEAKALTDLGRERLPGLQDLKVTPASAIKAMALDRASRMKIFSIENVLEPNLKTGAGGLREILHFDQIYKLKHKAGDILPAKPTAAAEAHVFEVMEHSRWFFNTLRLKCHELGGQDFLQADLQIELARWFGYTDFRALMKTVQLALSRVLFYSEWYQAWSSLPKKKRTEFSENKFSRPEQFKAALERDPSILTMFQVRQQMDQLITPTWIKKNPEFLEKWFGSVLSWKSPEKVLRAFFRSRLADMLDPRLRKIVGYNQHDQYHAYTADAHILNLLIEFKSVVQKPTRAGGFKKILQELSEKDRNILAWTCYYHDLGKGSAGDHEEIGSDYVRQDARRFGRPKAWTDEVDWLVRNHLEFSKAAFRGDPNDPNLHSKLHDLALTPDRIRRLMVFTFLDIRATHPKAWTAWKEQLLLNLYQKLRDPARTQEVQRRKILEKKYPELRWPGGFLSLAPFATLQKDLRSVLKKSQDTSFEFYPAKEMRKKGFIWVRYYNPKNEKGVLLSALRTLFALGCSVHQASILSMPFGVYDWFLVESPVGLDVLRKRVRILGEAAPMKIAARWDQVSMLSTTDTAWTILLQGKDARGLLMKTVQEMTAMGAEIKAARAQTWGRHVEDAIEMKPMAGDPEAWVQDLRSKLT